MVPCQTVIFVVNRQCFCAASLCQAGLHHAVKSATAAACADGDIYWSEGHDDCYEEGDWDHNMDMDDHHQDASLGQVTFCIFQVPKVFCLCRRGYIWV